MAQVKLIVGGRTYDLACRDGEEPRLEMLAQMLDSKARDAGQLVGSANETRQLLLARPIPARRLWRGRSINWPNGSNRLPNALSKGPRLPR